MDYFVAIENTAYDIWQIELLIESFKLLKLQDSLVLGVAGNSTKTKNVSEIKRVFCHDPHPFNSIYAVYAALQTGFLTEPFVLLHPDMILHEPFKEIHGENIVFHPYANDLKEGYVVNAGGAMRFNLVPHKFFKLVMNTAEQMKKLNREKPQDIVKAAWTSSILTASGYCDIIGSPLEVGLLNTEFADMPIIHYNKGMPPAFDKRLFYQKLAITDKNPYQVLLENNPTVVTNYVQKVVRSYQGDL